MKKVPQYIKSIWQFIVAASTTVIAFIIPLNIVFGFKLEGFYVTLYWLITLIFTLDIFFHLYFRVEDTSDYSGEVQSRKKYLKGWFIIDLLAAIPFLSIINVSALGFFRLLKFLRVAQYMHQWRQRVLKYGDYLILGFFVYWLFILAHWLACGWIALREYPAEIDNVTRYIHSIYWVTETLTTVGFGEIVPQNNAQHIYAMLIMLVGVGVYGFIIGNVASILSKIDPAKSRFYNNLEQLKVFVNYRNIPTTLQKRIRDYYAYIWKKKLGFDESSFLSTLPMGLQNEVSLYLKRQILEKIPLFKGVSDEFLREVSLFMRPLICVPDECVFKEGDIGNEMYFVIRGKLEVVQKGKVLSVLSDGDFFGEIALFTNDKTRTATVTSLTYSDLYRLDRKLFEAVLNKYPKIADHIKKIAKERMEYNEDFNRES